MTIKNNLGKSFGPVGSWAGYCLILAGIVATYTSLFGLILVVIGTFLGFTSTCALIDFEKRRIKFSEKLFGILQTGKWIAITPDMKIGIKESNMVWTAYSRSNRSVDLETNDFRIILFSANNKDIMPLKVTRSIEKAIVELQILCKGLNIKEIE
jgi:hypothetical protein